MIFTLSIFLLLPSILTAEFQVPRFAVEPANVMANGDGKSALFTCLLSQSPTPSPSSINWFYNGKQIDSLIDKIRIPLANGSLYVSAANVDQSMSNSPFDDVPVPDNHGYNCRATTQVKFHDRKYNATVISRMAHVSRHRQLYGSKAIRINALVGDVVTLVCGTGAAVSSINQTLEVEANSMSDREIKWYRDDATFPDDLTQGRVTVMDNGRIVEFNSFSNDDFGEYFCTQRAKSNKISKFVINPMKASQNNDLEPSLEFIIKPSEKMVVPAIDGHQAAILPCSAASLAVPSASLSYSWLKDGASVLMGGKYQIVGLGSLKISSLDKNDSAIYTCRVTLSVGPTTSFADTSVVFKVSPPPQICSFGANLVPATIGTTVELDCGIEHGEQFFWFHNGNYLVPNEESDSNESGDRENFYEYSSHRVSDKCGSKLNLWALTDFDSGVYQCFAVNSVGILSSSQFLAIEKGGDFISPAATMLRKGGDSLKRPLKLRALSRSATTVRLTWDAPLLSSEAIISGYVVLVRQTDDNERRNRRLFATNAEILVDHLYPGKQYEITVSVAFKQNGDSGLIVGDTSHPIVITTEVAMPDPTNNASGENYSSNQLLQQPRNVRVELQNPTTVSITWTPPAPPSSASPPPGFDLKPVASTRSLPNINRYRLFYRSGGSNSIRQQDGYIDLPGKIIL